MLTSAFLVTLALRMAIVACIVVLAAMIAERARPALAALVATLPISIGPTYALLAMDHDTAFLSAAALKSVPSTAGTLGFIAIYANTAVRFSPAPAIGLAYLGWIPLVLMIHRVDWSVAGALTFTGLALLIAQASMGRLQKAPPGPRAVRQWWDIPLRAAIVATLVAFITGLSHVLGSAGVGTLANFPIVMSSVGLIMHLRLGGRQTASMLANTVGGMAGVAVALLFVHLTIETLGSVVSLTLALSLCVVWNFGLYLRSRAALA